MGQQGVKKKKVVEGNVEKEKEKVEKKKKVPKVVWVSFALRAIVFVQTLHIPPPPDTVPKLAIGD